MSELDVDDVAKVCRMFGFQPLEITPWEDYQDASITFEDFHLSVGTHYINAGYFTSAEGMKLIELEPPLVTLDFLNRVRNAAKPYRKFNKV